MKQTGIYKITSPNGSVYIGQSRDISNRWKTHIRAEKNCQEKLAKSFNKHGFGCHEFSILHELPSDVDQAVLDTYEILYMNAFRDVGFELLNIREGGIHGALSAQTKAKLSERRMGRPSGLKPMLGKHHSQRVKDIISAANKGRPLSEEHKAKIGAKHKNKIVSEATRERMRLLNLGKKLSPESIAKRTATQKRNRELKNLSLDT